MPRALIDGTPLGHGGLPEEAVTHLRSLGYDPQDYRTAMGPRQLELWLQGVTLGTLEPDAVKFKVLDAARKHFSKSSKEETEAGLKAKGEKVDIITILTAGVEPRTETTKRRGRPPGKK